MPIAGNNVECFHLYIAKGHLYNVGKHRYPSHLVEDRIDEVVRALMAGRPVYLHAYADNLAAVKAALQAQGILV